MRSAEIARSAHERRPAPPEPAGALQTSFGGPPPRAVGTSKDVLFSLGFSIGYTDGLAVEAARGLATIVGGMRNDHWAKRNRKRRAKKRAEEAAERRHEELKEAWRRRREEGGPEEDSTGRNRKGRQE
jgi:hypothetical protein